MMSQWVYTPEQVRELDRIAIEEQGVPGYELMCRAGRVAFNAAREAFPAAHRWRIYCGSGNNAGDGFVIGELALNAGQQVELIAVSPPGQLQGDAATAYAAFLAAGGEVSSWGQSQGLSEAADICVDALLGTGLRRNVEGDYAAAVDAINHSGLPVLAVDVPSGLHGGTGAVMGAAVRADLTVTFVGLKQGLYLGAGPDCCGHVLYSDLAIAEVPEQRVSPQLRCADVGLLRQVLPERRRGGHKGRFGHVLVIGGNHGMAGAVRLTGEAALRAGAGLVSVATRAENVAAVLSGRPELMCRGVSAADDLDKWLTRASVIALGPGLGSDDWARDLYARALSAQVPVVIDADALNLLAAQPARHDNWVLTPHPGEAGRLLGISSAEVQADRLQALAALQDKYGGVILLKGAGTLVTGEERPWLVRAGNPGMATAGMGDVLTGVLAALLAQRPQERHDALAAAAAWAHACAGDRAALGGKRGMLAGDLISELRACLN